MRLTLVVAVVVLTFVTFVSSQEEERCDEFGDCLTECVKKLPESRQYMDIIDCSDQCVKSHCKDVRLKEIVNRPKKKQANVEQNASNKQQQKQQQQQQTGDDSNNIENVFDASSSNNDNNNNEIEVRFIRPLPGEIFPDGNGGVHFETKGSSRDVPLTTEILVNGQHATDTEKPTLSFQIEALAPGSHEFVARIKDYEHVSSSVRIRSVSADDPLLDETLALKTIRMHLANGGEEDVMIRQDIGPRRDQFGIRCSRGGSWVDIPLGANNQIDVLLSTLSKKFSRVYSKGEAPALAEQLRADLAQYVSHST